MRYLGLDFGSHTLGLAISDKTGLIASSYKTLRYHEVADLIEELLKIINEEEIDALVLGFPKNMDNTFGPRVEETMRFKSQLEEKCSLPIYLMDERLSTVLAEKTLLMNDTTRKKRKQVIDAVAATIILQSYLDLKGR